VRYLDRRQFLRGAAGALVASGLARAGLTQAPPAPAKKRSLKKGLGLGMIAAGSTLEEKFKIVKDLGFDGVEIDRPSKTPLDEILKARDAAGIEIPSIVDSTHWSVTLGDPDPKVRAAGVKDLETAMRDAKALGASSVLLVPCVVNDKIGYEDAWTRSQAEIRKVLPVAAELQVVIAVENVWNHFIMSPLEARRYVDDFASPWVGWHFDVGNVVNYGWPDQWIRVLGKRIQKLHVKDFSRKKRDAEGLWKGFDVKLLDGDAGWPAVMAALDEIGYSGWGIAEVAGGDRAALKDVSERMSRIFNL
jgi:hexulose-6-phosphate isomerase